MTQGPYAPPVSRVADRLETRRPKQVGTAVALLWISFALGFPSLYLYALRDPVTVLHPAVIAFALVTFLFSAVLNVLIYLGQNWARMVSLVLFLIAVPLTLIPFDEAVPAGALENGLTWASLVLDLVALYLLFSQPGASWFKRSES